MSDSKTSNDLKPYKPNEALALILICIAYVIPLGLWFSVVYSGSGGIGNSLLIFSVNVDLFSKLIIILKYHSE